jgi:hypothetical protein
MILRSVDHPATRATMPGTRILLLGIARIHHSEASSWSGDTVPVAILLNPQLTDDIPQGTESAKAERVAS